MFPGPRKKSFFRSANAVFGKLVGLLLKKLPWSYSSQNAYLITYINIWLGMFHVTKKRLEIVELHSYAISNETVQIVKHLCNSRMSAIFWF